MLKRKISCILALPVMLAAGHAFAQTAPAGAPGDPDKLRLDAAYMKLGLKDKFEKIKSANLPDDDVKEMRLEAILAETHAAAAKGPMAEWEAQGEIIKQAQAGGPLAGEHLDMGWTTDSWWTISAGIMKNDAYQKAPPIDRMKMLDDWQKRHMIFGNDVAYYADALVNDYVARAVKDAPLAKRGLARFAALNELQKAGFSANGGTFWSSLRDAAKFGWWEYMAHDADWAKMSPKERLAQVAKLVKDYGLDEGTRNAMETELAERMLLADAAFMAKDLAGRAADIDALQKNGQISANGWPAHALKDKLATEIKAQPNRELVPDLEKALQTDGAFTAADAKGKLAIAFDTMRKKQVVSGDWVLHDLYFAAVQNGDSSKPLSAAAELDKVKELMAFLDTKKLADSFSGFKPFTDAALAQMMLESPEYQKGDAWARLALIQKWEKAKMVAPYYSNLAVLQPAALVTDSLAAPLTGRGQAILKAMAKLKATAPNEARYSFEQEMPSTLALFYMYNTDFAKAAPRAKLTKIGAMQTQGLIDDFQCANMQTPVAVRMLQADAAFMKADAAGKKKIIGDLYTQKVIGFFAQDQIQNKLAK